MKVIRCFLLAGAVAAGFSARAATAENPYDPIVTRNVFGLVPIPVVDPASLVPETPPPKITPNGIMTLFGKLQVLFKVAVTAPDQPPKDESYVLGEGERQDEIEVQKIDEKAATITFNNHGTIQELPLVVGKASSGVPPPAAPGGVPGVPGRGPVPVPGVSPVAGGTAPPVGFGGRFGRTRTAPGAANPAGGGVPGLGAAANSGGGVTPQVNENGVYSPGSTVGDKLTPEEVIILREAQREKYRQEGNPLANLLPPTAITKDLENETAPE